MTTIRIEFRDMCRPEQERKRLALVFRNAMLDYCSNGDILKRWYDKHHMEWGQAKMRGFFAVRCIIGEREPLYPIVTFVK